MKKRLLKAVIIFFMTASAFSFVQEKTNTKDLPVNHRKWLTEEVFYIITPVEKDVFLRLTTSRERDLFIEAFWKQRDPTPGTEKNEFREEHYRRFNHANRRFRGYGKEGWQTDRGKVYIILGEPMDVRIFHGSDAYYPSESWYYQGMAGYGLPQAFNLLFYQKGRIGDFILYNPGVEGPWNLLSNYMGNPGDYEDSYLTLDVIEPELAQLSINLIPGESPVHLPSLSSSILVQNIDTAAIRKIKDQYAQQFFNYKDIIEVEYSANFMDSDSEVQIIQDESGINVVHFSIQPKNLSMATHENSIYTNLEFNGMITDKDGHTIFQFDKQIPLRFTEEQFLRMRQRPFSFTDSFPLIPGEYRFSLLLKNSISKEFTSFEKHIHIAPEATSPRMSPLLLGFNMTRPSTQKDLNNPFVVKDVQIYSQAKKSFIPKDNLYVHFQILGISDDLWNKGSLRYIIYKEDTEFLSITHAVTKYQDRLDYIEMFSLDKFPPGYYKIVVSLLDERQNDVFSQQKDFEVSPLNFIPRPWVMAKYMIDPEKANTDYILGTEWLNKGNPARASDYLEKAYRAHPNHPAYGLQFAKAKSLQGRHAEATEILVALSGLFKDDYDLNFALGQSYQASGEYTKAVDVYKQTASQFGVNTNLLNSLGECHAKLGNTNEAIAAWEKSLEINPDQEEIKELLRSFRK